MGLSFFTVVFDSDHPQKVGGFWAAALDRELIEDEPEWWTSLPGDPQLHFMKVPEGKTTKNRMHLDWAVPERETAVQRFVSLGATRLWDIQETVGEDDMEWTTLADTEGNEFCLIQSDKPMGLRLATVVFDSNDPQRVGLFWAAALERELVQVELANDYWLPGDPPLTFVKVPEGKTTKNRVHIDWYASHREAEVERIIGLGATRLWDRIAREETGFEWTTLADTEGNEFCVVQSDQP